MANVTTNKELAKFKAKVNVNTAIQVGKYPEVKALIANRLSELSEGDSDAKKAPWQWSMRAVKRGDILTFGDKCELDENGFITCFPKEVFEMYADRYIELPCQMEGNTTVNFDRSLQSLPIEMRAEMEKKREKITARFDVQPIMERI